MTRDRGSVRGPLLGSQSETVVGQLLTAKRNSCPTPMSFPVYAYQDHSFQAIGNSTLTRPLSTSPAPPPVLAEAFASGFSAVVAGGVGGAWAEPATTLGRPLQSRG